jgi:hypothetical protein
MIIEYAHIKILRHAVRLSVPVTGWLIPLNGKRAYTIGGQIFGLRDLL